MIRCSLCQKYVSFQFDSGHRLPRLIEAHVERCPECRSYRMTLRALRRQLVAEAPTAQESPPSWLPARVMAALDWPASPRVASSSRSRVAWQVAAACVLMVAGASLALQEWRSASVTRPPAPVPPLISAAGLAPARAALAQGERLLQASAAWDQPLEAEMQSLVKDANMAARLLADSLLPDAVR